MVNYQQGKIYKIVSNIDDSICYVGSTCKEKLCQRMTQHRADYKKWQRGIGGKVRVYDLFDKFGVDHCQILLVEIYSCNSKDELTKKEAEYIKMLSSVNVTIPHRTRKEYIDDNKEIINNKHKQYVQKNKEKIAEQHKEYRKNNKEKIYEKTKEYIQKNKEKIDERRRNYSEKNKENKKEYMTEYRKNNKEKIKEQRKEYKERNKEKIKRYKQEYKKRIKENDCLTPLEDL